MLRIGAAACVALAAGLLAACGNGGGTAGAGYNPGGGGPGPTPIPPGSIGISLPTGKLGVEADPVWGTVGGYTQAKGSQVLAFPPGTKVTLRNLSTDNQHTLDVIAVSSGPPAAFPPNPTLAFTASGHGELGAGYASGIIQPGKSVTVTLAKPGTYLIGCAFHYAFGMRDVIQISASATPGPQATPGSGPNLENAALVDQNGRSFTLKSLRGRPLVLAFVSAHCTDACPLIEAQLASAAREFARRGIAARLLAVTLDPERDRPSDMRAIAREFSADPNVFLLASGAPRAVHALMNAFGVQTAAGENGDLDAHTSFVYLLDRDGDLARTMLASSGLGDDLVAAFEGRRLAVKL